MALKVFDPHFFDEPSAWGDWLRNNHDAKNEVWVGFCKDSGLPSMSWSEAVYAALCWRWIDGLCKKISVTSYVHRFTPRRRRSIWSNVNLAKVEILIAKARMHPPGLAAYERREARHLPHFAPDNSRTVAKKK